MHLVGGTSDASRELRTPRRPVLVDDWAEALIELARAQSRRRHPSNPEPAWHKDGGYESDEWAV